MDILAQRDSASGREFKGRHWLGQFVQVRKQLSSISAAAKTHLSTTELWCLNHLHRWTHSWYFFQSWTMGVIPANDKSSSVCLDLQIFRRISIVKLEDDCMNKRIQVRIVPFSVLETESLPFWAHEYRLRKFAQVSKFQWNVNYRSSLVGTLLEKHSKPGYRFATR